MLLLFCSTANLWATHYRAGEITYKRVSGTTYEITVNTYTDPSSRADRSTGSVIIDWGDNSPSTTAIRKFRVTYATNSSVVKNVYIETHTYGIGSYIISVTDKNRVNGILNINGGLTADIAFCITSGLNVNGSIGFNSSPILRNPPIDKGCKNFVYVHNPEAYDPDGDSLVYDIVAPSQEPGVPVPNYVDPAASDSFKLDARTGRLIWAHPLEKGFYNIAIRIREYRKPEGGIPLLVGQVVRDMQIYIDDCIDSPPVLKDMSDACIWKGNEFHREVTATDPNNFQQIKLYGVSQPFEFNPNPATITPDPGVGVSAVSVDFRWTPVCRNIRYEPFWIGFQVQDNFSIPLSDYKGFFLKVIAPPPTNVQVKQDRNESLQVSWNKEDCGLASKYKVYRRIDSSHWKPDSCFRGIPASTGFKLIKVIDAVANPSDTFYSDDDGGKGLSPLVPYCYRVVSVYPARAENGSVIGGVSSDSYTSAEVCGQIIRNKPIITKASVTTTDALNGAVLISWLRPDTLDTTNYKPPYKLLFKHGSDNATSQIIKEVSYPTFSQIPDSSLVDSGIDTKNKQWFYRIELRATLNGNEVKADQSPIASTIFSKVYSTDNTNMLSWDADIPWTNDSFVVFRKNSVGTFIDIAHTTVKNYSDTGLVNGSTYCYRIESFGAYPSYPLRIDNYSQEICGTPIDTVPPCPPILSVKPPCDDYTHFENLLSWVQQGECDKDVVSYNIYFKHEEKDEFELIATIPANVYTYTDIRDILKKSIAGCYGITAVDSFSNESKYKQIICIDNCPEYRLPNVFTPNGDNTNDLFKPFQYRFIDHISLQIYNRWGDKVFTSNDMNVNWDGKDQKSGAEVSDGIYFYVCEVYEQYLDGLRKRVIKGTVQIIR